MPKTTRVFFWFSNFRDKCLEDIWRPIVYIPCLMFDFFQSPPPLTPHGSSGSPCSPYLYYLLSWISNFLSFSHQKTVQFQPWPLVLFFFSNGWASVPRRGHIPPLPGASSGAAPKLPGAVGERPATAGSCPWLLGRSQRSDFSGNLETIFPRELRDTDQIHLCLFHFNLYLSFSFKSGSFGPWFSTSAVTKILTFRAW